MKKIIYAFLLAMIATWSFTSCEDVPAPYEKPTGEEQTNKTSDYINETFTQSFGVFEVKTINGTPWKIDFSTAKATGFDFKTKKNTPSDSYLISPEIDLSKSKGAFVQFEYILQYVKNEGVNEVLITNEYTNDPTSTKWENITGQLTPGKAKDWKTFYPFSKNIPDAYIGKNKVRIALHYTATNKGSRTWEVKNLVVKEGKASETETKPNTKPDEKPSTGTEAIGKGTKEEPYNVAAALKKRGTKNAYVKGYIVGYIPGKAKNDAKFTAENCNSQTNILIADKADETNVNNCLPIQLPKGKIREGLNLKDHKDWHKKEVVLYGNIDKYYGVTGIKEVSYAIVDGKEIGKQSTGNQTTTKELFSETFAKGQGNFTIVNEKDLPEGVKNVWVHNAKYKQMKASAFANSKRIETDSWLISPAIDLSKLTKATLTFTQVANYFNSVNSEIFIKISTNYNSGKPSAATWETLTADKTPTGKNWEKVETTIDLSKYAGKKNIRIAFQYTSSTTSAGTWQIQNIVVK